ncbi:Glyoxylate/hydroxypyruvate reductase B [Rhodobacteraceae bacterium THAF1]|uniref:2-hydroxyacid dehydrogenase n=1 Tax=Palleronia sp. THAF1 TaxID=2587842 RepID=UPI000F3CD64B|nr:2-hydroxyacid dehydrogenase [Palleronia sp. THAF1]QFU07251.1 Glyoxylate/hydroxypyruvate reductase B [Palleronia sp. THAF1]VDC20837.1 Glyoxylate/hydroxypyruvate reductase B [Rhodobacteraceae bacterium THAF1]
MPDIISIGAYPKVDRAALAGMGAVPFATLEEALAMDDRDSVRAIACIAVRLDAATMDAFPNLGIIANCMVGYDSIDVKAARERGIAVTNTPDVLNDDVADLAVALLFAQARGMVQADAHVRTGAWATEFFPLNRKVSGGTVGILGLGRIGQEIADRLAAFKMDIHYWSRSEKETPGWTYHADPVSLAHAVDFLIVACVGGPETRDIVSSEVIEALGKDGVIVNISRGSTIDEAALLDALENGRLAGAGLDVFENEPAPNPRFTKLDNVVLQPHQASATHATRAAMGQLQRDNIAAFLKGEPLLTQVN